MVCEVDCKVSACISQRTKGLGREGIGTSMLMQY